MQGTLCGDSALALPHLQLRELVTPLPGPKSSDIVRDALKGCRPALGARARTIIEAPALRSDRRGKDYA